MTIIILSGVLGFLLASLIALFLAPPLWRKAVKVTTRKLLQQSPRMMSDGQADRDQMRAEFAITTRKMEAKIEQLREVSDTQLIELSTTEKKRERLLEKIKNLQTTVEDHEELIEKLNRKTEPLEAKAYELDQHKQKVSQLTKKLETHNKMTADLKQEVGVGREKVSQLAKKLETHNKTAAGLMQEVGMGREKIIDLIGKIEAKDNSITQLTREIETLKSLETIPSNEASREHNDNKVSLAIASAKQPHTPAKPLAPVIIKSRTSGSSSNGLESTTNSSPCAETGMRRPKHSKLRSGKKPKPVKTPESLSLAERIRALQSDHPKSI